MKTRPVISIVCNTAREGYSMPGAFADVHIFDLLVDSLESQRGDIPPFELVIADTEYDTRASWFENRQMLFPVKHVPVDSWWLDRGLTAISRCKNESVIHAEGSHIITVDDSTRLPPHWLATCWEYFRRWNMFPVSWYRVHDLDGNPLPVDRQTDGRLAMIPEGKRRLASNMTPEAWAARDYALHGWGYVGFTADAFYGVNGYEEWYDGGRGQEDIEFSLRLLRAGHRLVVDRELYVDVLQQGPVAIYRNAEIPTGVVHCTSALSPILYDEIAEGQRHRANAEPYPERILSRMAPVCCWYCPDERHDVTEWACMECGSTVRYTPAALRALGDPVLCGACAVPMAENTAARVDLAWRCTLYRDPCPFAPKSRDGLPPLETYMHACHPLFGEAFIANPARWIRDLRADHERAIETRPDRATFVGVDWR